MKMTNEPVEVVKRLLAKMGESGGFIEAIEELFADDVYRVPGPGWPNEDGKAAVLEEVRKYYAEFPVTHEVEIVSIAANGTKVLTERVDYFNDADGTRLHELPLMGVFEVVDGKITYWRDYFDPRLVEAFGAAVDSTEF